MPSAEAIIDEVCRGLGRSDSEILEVHWIFGTMDSKIYWKAYLMAYSDLSFTWSRSILCTATESKRKGQRAKLKGNRKPKPRKHGLSFSNHN
jgi:hypothetical protein